jgi:hypothetical protein
MTEQRFDELVNATLEHLRDLLVVKGKEYRRNNNVFHNFDEGSKRTGLIREKVLDGMLLKHEISIADMTNDLAEGKLPKLHTVNEKFDDNLIYLLIKKMSIIDKIEKYDEEQKHQEYWSSGEFLNVDSNVSS